MSNTKILVVEDDRQMLDVIRRYLENHDYRVICTGNGSEALVMARDSRPDLAVLDANLPGLDGFSLCLALKSAPETAHMPVIIISGARTDDEDIVEGYDRGADDYLAKPFDFQVLTAKINAVLRRYGAGRAATVLREKGLELDPEGRTARVGGKPVQLTRKEFDLLTLLLEKKGRVLGVPYLLETVWGYDMATYDKPHTVETHVSSLRRKLGEKLGERIQSVTGHGYKFE
ncbi:MAG: DNA-binding response regulator [Elusimicrobia bacterium HGW-Elusimicrobia-3]|nr:MAG: DNA-binding response regulator [Elusimicrobia bacterium HGW-Elusimicrobia-3]